MTIRKFKNFKIECEECCEINFTEDETFVSNNETGEDFKLMSYEDWLDLPLHKVIKLGGEDYGNWYSLLYKVWVICPECGQYHFVWYDRLYHILTQPTKEWKNVPLRQLIEEKKVTLVKHIDFDDAETECVYGPEEEILK